MTSFKNSGNTLLSIIGLLVIALILSLNLNTFYWADDYAVLNEIHDLGIYQRCIHGYFTWDGRYLTPAAFLQGAFLELLPVQVITLLWNSCFLASGVLLFCIIKEDTKDKISTPNKIYLPFLIGVIFWLGSYPHIGQTIYWATGGVYSFNLLLGAIWLFLFYKVQKIKALGVKIAFLLFTVVVGLTTQNLTIGFVALLVLTIVSDFLKNERKNIRYNILLLLIILGGTVFLSLAPGNFIRAKEINDSAFGGITLWIIIKNFSFTLLTYLKLSLVLTVVTILTAFAFVSRSGYKISATIKNLIFIPKTKEQFIIFIGTYKYLIVALSTILPFITMPEVVSPRTAIYFMFFLVIFIFRFLYELIVIKMSTKENRISSFIAYALFSAAFCFIVYNFQKGSELKTEITKREQLLKNSRNKVVSIKKIEENLKSYCYDFRDFRGNDDWAVDAQKIYFGCSEIRIED